MFYALSVGACALGWLIDWFVAFCVSVFACFLVPASLCHELFCVVLFCVLHSVDWLNRWCLFVCCVYLLACLACLIV